MIDDIRASAAPKVSPLRTASLNEGTGFGSALGAALDRGTADSTSHLPVQDGQAAPQQQAGPPQHAESRQTDQALQSRRRLDRTRQTQAESRQALATALNPTKAPVAAESDASPKARPKSSETPEPPMPVAIGGLGMPASPPLPLPVALPPEPIVSPTTAPTLEGKEPSALVAELATPPITGSASTGASASQLTADGRGVPTTPAASLQSTTSPVPATSTQAAPKPLPLEVLRPDPADTAALAGSLMLLPGHPGERSSPAPKPLTRETPPPSAALDARSHPVLPGMEAPASGGDTDRASLLLSAIQGMREAATQPPGSAAPTGDGNASSFAATLANLTQSFVPAMPVPQSGVTLENPWPLQDPAFPAHLAGQVSEALLAGLDRADITVSPPELGPIRIELALSGESASVAFSAAHPDTREAIERSLPTLATMLSEHGMTLSQSSVNDGSAQANGRQADREPSGAPPSSGADRPSGSALPGVNPPASRPRVQRGLLDLFA